MCAVEDWGRGGLVASTFVLSVFCRRRKYRRLLPDVPWGDPTPPLAATAMSGPGNKRVAGDGGSGPPEKLSREEKTTTTLIEPIRLGGISSTVRGFLPQPSQLARLPTVLHLNRPEPYYQFPKFSRIGTLLKEMKNTPSTFPLQIGKQAPRGRVPQRLQS